MWKVVDNKLHEDARTFQSDDWNINYAETKKVSKMYQFRLLDADGNVYFEGLSTEKNFEPLDFTQYKYGCTDIEYYDYTTDNWAVL